MTQPTDHQLPDVIAALRGWQHDGTSLHLHPGDVGWYWRFGAEATAGAVRTWTQDGRIVVVGLLDGPGLVRLAIAPELQRDVDLGHRIMTDVSTPSRGVLPEGAAAVEAPAGSAVRELLHDIGWVVGDPWTPLRRDLIEPVAEPDLRVEAVGADEVSQRVAVHRAAFTGSTFTEDHWRAMAAGPAYPDAACLVGYDRADVPVAAVTVWSAGPGRPGLIEPMGVHPDHRGHGYGTAITVAAARALRRMGSSSAQVCTPSRNVGAIATYEAAGFLRRPDVCDLARS